VRTWLALATLAVVLLGAGPARAEKDHERALRAREAGEIMPLAELLEKVEASFEGRVIEVELERDDGRWIYEVEILTPSGSVLELEYDARDGTFLEGEGAGLEAARKRTP